MQQKEVLLIVGVVLIGFLLISQTNMLNNKQTSQESSVLSGAATSGSCECPYATGNEFVDTDFQLKDGTWLWNWLGVLWSDSSPRYVARATGCLSRGPNECWTQTCLVILGDVFGNNEVREYRCGWPPPPSGY